MSYCDHADGWCSLIDDVQALRQEVTDKNKEIKRLHSIIEHYKSNQKQVEQVMKKRNEK
jgi:hypothetical protein